MPVAKTQIVEVYDVLRRYVDVDDRIIGLLLRDLQETRAYTVNESFRETIDRLMNEYRKRMVKQ